MTYEGKVNLILRLFRAQDGSICDPSELRITPLEAFVDILGSVSSAEAASGSLSGSQKGLRDGLETRKKEIMEPIGSRSDPKREPFWRGRHCEN